MQLISKNSLMTGMRISTFSVAVTKRSTCSIYSEHDNYYEDRRYRIGCIQVSIPPYELEDCVWTDYVNDWDEEVDYECPTNKVMTGMASVHDNHKEDRRWKFRCCGTKNGYTTSCSQSDFINDWDEPMAFYLGGTTTVFTGVYSVHDNHYE